MGATEHEQASPVHYGLTIAPFERGQEGNVASLFNEHTARLPYCGTLSADGVEQRVCTLPYFDPDGLLIAYRGGRPVGFAHGTFGAPPSDGAALNYGVGNVRALLFPPDDPEAGRLLLAELLAYLRRQGAHDLQGWGSFAGYPFYRGLYMGTEPVAAASQAHVIVRFRQAGFAVNQFSIFLARPLEAPPPPGQATPPVVLREAPLIAATAWEGASWTGLRPLQTTAWRDGQQRAAITWALLPDLEIKRGCTIGSIAALSVDPQARQQGIARALVLEVMRQCYRAGAREITVATTQENTAALQTYYACGFTEKEILLGHGLLSHPGAGSAV